jgi:apolipoprotein N-acyltransferase
MPAALADPLVPRRTAIGCLAGFAGLFAAMGVAGHVRLNQASDATVPGVRLRIVQGNISQHEKRSTDMRLANFIKYLRLSATYAQAPVTHVIWPETAVPFALEQSPDFLRAIAEVTPAGGLTLTGALRWSERPGTKPEVFNSLAVIDDAGSVVATYDKFHLVPFGEYMPLRDVLPLEPVAAGALDFSAGPGPRTLRLPGLPAVSPLICYEAIFPAAVTERNDRPEWLLNVTNDGWYGKTAGPHQHLAISRVRAVEEGLPLVRAANTGISAIVDSYGRLVAYLGLGEEGVLDGSLPSPIKPTPYARFGDLFFLCLLASGLLTVFSSRYVRSR